MGRERTLPARCAGSPTVSAPSCGQPSRRCCRSPGQGPPTSGVTVDFEIPADIQSTLDELDAFIEHEIRPLEQADDNVRFFDHRREYARTDFDNGGVPRQDWEDLLAEMRRRANAAGWLRHALPAEYGGHDASNLEMAIIREHLATKGLGLHNDLQNESSIVGNFPTVLMMRDFGTDAQRAEWMPGFPDGTRRLAFGLTDRTTARTRRTSRPPACGTVTSGSSMA